MRASTFWPPHTAAAGSDTACGQYTALRNERMAPCPGDCDSEREQKEQLAGVLQLLQQVPVQIALYASLLLLPVSHPAVRAGSRSAGSGAASFRAVCGYHPCVHKRAGFLRCFLTAACNFSSSRPQCLRPPHSKLRRCLQSSVWSNMDAVWLCTCADCKSEMLTMVPAVRHVPPTSVKPTDAFERYLSATQQGVELPPYAAVARMKVDLRSCCSASAAAPAAQAEYLTCRRGCSRPAQPAGRARQ